MPNNPIAFPFHATVKWPAQAGLPELMVNTYADGPDQLAAAVSAAIEALRAEVPAFTVATQERQPAPQDQPHRQPEPHYEPDDEAAPNVRCIHNGRDWRQSRYDGWWIPDCGCELRGGELKAKAERRQNNDRRYARGR